MTAFDEDWKVPAAHIVQALAPENGVGGEGAGGEYWPALQLLQLLAPGLDENLPWAHAVH